MKFFLFGEFFINILRSMFMLGAGAIFYEQTGGLWVFAAAFILEMVLLIFLQGAAGVLVDKYGTKKILVLSMFVFLIPLALLSIKQTDISQEITLLFVLVSLLSVINPMIRAATFVTLRRLCDKSMLEKMNGKQSIAIQTGQLVGMFSVGLIMQFSGLQYILYIQAVAAALCLVCYLKLPQHLAHPVKSENGEGNQPVSYRGALTYLKENPALLLIILFGTFDIVLVAVFNLLLAPVVKNNLGDDGVWLAILDAAFALGSIFSAKLIASRREDLGGRFDITLLMLLSAMVLLGGYYLSLGRIYTLALVALFGFTTALSCIVWNSELQKRTSESILGRMSSIKNIMAAILVTITTSIISNANESSFELATMSGVIVSTFFAAAYFILYQFVYAKKKLLRA